MSKAAQAFFIGAADFEAVSDLVVPTLQLSVRILAYVFGFCQTRSLGIRFFTLVGGFGLHLNGAQRNRKRHFSASVRTIDFLSIVSLW